MHEDDFPTLEAAQNAGLEVSIAPRWKFWDQRDMLDHSSGAERVGAIRIVGRLLVRHERETIESFGTKTLQSMHTQAPNRERSTGGRFRYIRQINSAGPTKCTMCAMQPGRVECTVCGGTGLVHAEDGNGNMITLTCSGCSGRGTFKCNACDGSTQSQEAQVVWVEDLWSDIDYLYLPNLPLSLDCELRAELDEFDKSDTWPDSLSVSLEEKLDRGAPYRSAAPPTDETFKGYVIEEAIEQARNTVEGISGSGALLRSDVKAWVLPFVRAHHEGRHLIVYRRPGGPLRVHSTD